MVHARLELALQAAGMGTWDWDVHTGALVWDDVSRAMFGLSAADVTGSVSDIEAPIHPDDLPRVQAALDTAVATAGIVDVEFRVVWPDGSVHWMYARGRALLDGGGEVWRVIGTNVDVTAPRRAAEQRTADAERMAGLVAVARALGDTATEAQVLDVIGASGAELLGAQGTALCLPLADGARLRALTISTIGPTPTTDVLHLPADFPLPMLDAMRTGDAHFFTDRATAVARFPGAERTYRRTGVDASASVPLRARGAVLGSLSVALTGPRTWRPADRDLLVAFAALTAQALDRIRAREAEEEANAAARGLSETLQRSLLTDPPEPNVLQVAARYQPASQDAQVGGDWHDTFLTADGGTTVVIGDVAGHDGTATAAMAQVRNVLRGVAQTVGEPPSAVLSALDRALWRLRFPALTTAVLGQVLQDARGDRALLWSNAGHPPPLLVTPAGEVGLLWRPADLLLGVAPGSARHDHVVPLPPGTTLVLYTDGLVERRGEPLDRGLDRLVEAVTELHRLPTDELCDQLLRRLGADAEDDVALLVLRPRE